MTFFSYSSDLLDSFVKELRLVYASRPIRRRDESEGSGLGLSEAQDRGRLAIRRFNVRFPREQ